MQVSKTQKYEKYKFYEVTYTVHTDNVTCYII